MPDISAPTAFRGAKDRLLVTIAGPDRRQDLRVPVDSSVDEILPRLLTMLVEAEDLHEHVSDWSMVTATGSVLAGPLSLADNGIGDGEMLYLEPVAVPVSGLRRAAARDHGPMVNVWNAPARRSLTAGASSALIALVALVLAVHPASSQWPAVAALVVGLGATAGVGGLVKVGAVRSPWPAIGPLALTAVGMWQAAIGGGSLLTVCAVAIVLAVATGTLLFGGARSRPWVIAVAAVLLPSGFISGVTYALGGFALAAAGVGVVVWSVVLQFAPRLAVFVSGADRPPAGDRTVRAPNTPLEDRQVTTEVALERARPTLTSLLAGASFGLGAGWAVMVATASWAGFALTATSTVLVGLRARQHRRTVEVAILAATAAAGLLASLTLLAGLLAATDARPLDMLLAATVSALGIGVVGSIRSVPKAGFGLRRVLRRVEVVLRLSLIPLALWACGVFGGVISGSAQLTQHL